MNFRLKTIFSLILTFGLGFAAQASELDNLTDSERQSFRDEVRAYLLENPEVLMEAIAVLEERQQAAQEQANLSLVADNAAAIFEDGYSWVGGNLDGDITMVEFLDYRCGYCRRAHDQVAELVRNDGNIRIIVKEYPILGEQSLLSSQLAIATLQTAGKDAYKNVNDSLMRFNGDLNEATIRHLLGGLNLDADVILPRMGSDEVATHIADVRALGDRMQVTGTPTFVIQGEIVRGYIPPEDMVQMIAFLREQTN